MFSSSGVLLGAKDSSQTGSQEDSWGYIYETPLPRALK